MCIFLVLLNSFPTYRRKKIRLYAFLAVITVMRLCTNVRVFYIELSQLIVSLNLLNRNSFSLPLLSVKIASKIYLYADLCHDLSSLYRS